MGRSFRVQGVQAGLLVSLFTIFFPNMISASHPSLFFSAADIQGIRTKATTTHAAIMKPILSQANSLLSQPVPSAPAGPAFTLLSNCGRDIKVLAFAWVATGDSRYLNLVRQYLAAFSSWPFWGADAVAGDRDLTLGSMITGCAYAYDWTYDSLSASERVSARAALVRHSQEMYEAATLPYKTGWNNWWTESYGQNHWDSNNSALGLAALALDGETDSCARWLTYTVAQMRRDSFDLAHIVDGTWHEGCLYQNGKLTTSMPFYVNLKRIKGVDLLPASYLSAFALFALYNYLPAHRQMALTFSSYIQNWGGWLSSAGYSLLALAGSWCGSGTGQWLWKKMAAELGTSSYQSGCHVNEFFYYSPAAIATPPIDIPLSKTFSDLQAVIWRTGWGDSDLTFGLKTGAYGGKFLCERYLSKQFPFDTAGANLNVGHDHADANTFWLYRGAVTLMGENEGRSLYNDLNAAYQSSSHNTLLVDGRGQYFPTNQTGVYADDDGALGTGCSASGYDFIESDATRRYRATTPSGGIGPPMVSRFFRNVLFVRPSYFLIIDNVADSATHAYKMRFHFGDSATTAIDSAEGWIRAKCAQNTIVGLKPLVPAPFAWKEIDSVRPAVDITPLQPAKQIDFAFVVLPTTGSQWAARPVFSLAGQTPQATAVHASGSIAFDHVIRHSGAADTVSVAGYRVAGKVAGIGKSGANTIRGLFLGSGSMIADSNGSRTLFQSTRPVNAARIVFADTAITVFLDQQGAPDLRFFAPGAAPSIVRVPGWKVTAVSAGDYIRITGTAQGTLYQSALKMPGAPRIQFEKTRSMIRVKNTRSGSMIIRAFQSSGRCVWKSVPRRVSAGTRTDVPFQAQKLGQCTLIFRVEVDGTPVAHSLAVWER